MRVNGIVCVCVCERLRAFTDVLFVVNPLWTFRAPFCDLPQMSMNLLSGLSEHVLETPTPQLRLTLPFGEAWGEGYLNFCKRCSWQSIFYHPKTQPLGKEGSESPVVCGVNIPAPDQDSEFGVSQWDNTL